MSNIDPEALRLADHGAERFPGAVRALLPALEAALAALPRDHAGVRIRDAAALRPHLSHRGEIGALAAQFLGSDCRAVRAVLFDKTAGTNWSLAWHQDRTICVRARIAVDGFGPWTVKQGMVHVAPPFDLLTRMVTLRVHLDDVPADNAPLLIAPGSHRYGFVAVGDIAAVVRQCGQSACIATAGDVWVYSTPILHASEAASWPKARRVLQVDFAAEALPGGLAWLGV